MKKITEKMQESRIEALEISKACEKTKKDAKKLWKNREKFEPQFQQIKTQF